MMQLEWLQCIWHLALGAPNQREILISTGKSIPPENFDNKTGACSGRTNHVQSVQQYLYHEIAKLEDVIKELEIDEEAPSLKSIKDRYLFKSNFDNFIDFSAEQLELEKGTLSLKTWRNYDHCLNNLKIISPDCHLLI